MQCSIILRGSTVQWKVSGDYPPETEAGKCGSYSASKNILRKWTTAQVYPHAATHPHFFKQEHYHAGLIPHELLLP